MKKCFFIIIKLFTVVQSIGQHIDVLNLREEKVSLYSPSVISGKLLYLKMDYGSAHISNSKDLQQLEGATIASIDFVYTDHPVNADFIGLTKRRIENLKKLYPKVFSDKSIKWRLIRQQAFMDKEGARKLFHGIVVAYRPMQTPEETKKELIYLKKLFPDPHTIKVESITYVDAVELSSEYKTDSVFKRGKILSKRAYSGNEVFSDSTVLVALKRNQWKNMTIVADLTGSMSPYTAQLLIWLKLYAKQDRVRQFVFFNDGDRTPDNKKIIGKTGGIYSTKVSNFELVRQLTFTTMKNGCGGDAPENNIEALLKAIELQPDAENIIMIADNWAGIKDMKLASQIKKPIRIIVCGANAEVNPDYLHLAKITGGSVHTFKEDITTF